MTATEPFPPALALWAKTPRTMDEIARYGPDATHALLYHLLDVAMVTHVLYTRLLSPAARRGIAAGLGMDDIDAAAWIPFLAGLHDLGKASPVFQFCAQSAVVKKRVCDAGFSKPHPDNPTRHGTISALLLRDLLKNDYGWSSTDAQVMAVAIGGHHGTFPSADTFSKEIIAYAAGRRLGDPAAEVAWAEAQASLVMRLRDALGGVPPFRPVRLDAAAVMALAGFVSVADWIGSTDRFFPFIAIPDVGWDAAIASYLRDVNGKAMRAFARLQWYAPPILEDMPDFATRFEIETPNAMQLLADEAIGPRLDSPGLIIIEAPMGQGKTEAALALLEHATIRQGLGGAYIALPTQATSNQMFKRVREHLERRLREHGERVNLMLLHGHAALSENFDDLKKATAADPAPDISPTGLAEDERGNALAVMAAVWFTYRKRGLLAPWGVGTVDQGLLAVLQTRHVFVRLFGLAHKVIVIDEAHAYDTYMTTLLERLLEWLSALGCTVIILSATLPRKRRVDLIRAYARGARVPDADTLAIPDVDYPRLTSLIGDAVGAIAVPREEGPKEIALRWLPTPLIVGGDCALLAARLIERLTGGGCAAVICNTVRRAQEVYRTLKARFAALPDAERPALDLFHARYRFIERAEREKRVLDHYGKPGPDGTSPHRPPRSVLVATQVIEQSLDLDFDLMVSELAPADLVLQRAGRLHRHKRGERPTLVNDPVLLLAPPESVNADGVPRFGPSRYVYDPHILLCSWLALDRRDGNTRKKLVIPDDVEPLIESVYSEDLVCSSDNPAIQAYWSETKQTLRERQDEYFSRASKNTILPPQYDDDLFSDFNIALEEDAPEITPALQALTRLSDINVTAIILHTDEDSDVLLYANDPQGGEHVRALLQRSVAITNSLAASVLLVRKPPTSWKENSLLRHCRLVVLSAQNQNEDESGRFSITLDHEVGIVIERNLQRG